MKWSIVRDLILVLVPALVPGLSIGAGDPTPVRAELLADGSSLDSGQPVSLVVRLEMDPGWHVYWRNPGDAGLATEIELILPAGLSAGAMTWPTPSRFEEPGGIVAFGYSGELVVATRLEADTSGPAGANNAVEPPGSSEVVAEVSWLACKSRCVLGDARLSLALPVDSATAARARRLVSELRKSEPAPSIDAEVGSIRVLGGLEEGRSDGRVSVWLQWRSEPDGVELFPDPEEGLEVGGVTARTRGSLSRLDAELRWQGKAGRRPSSLDSVVVVLREGHRTGYRLEIPLVPGDRASEQR